MQRGTCAEPRTNDSQTRNGLEARMPRGYSAYESPWGILEAIQTEKTVPSHPRPTQAPRRALFGGTVPSIWPIDAVGGQYAT